MCVRSVTFARFFGDPVGEFAGLGFLSAAIIVFIQISIDIYLTCSLTADCSLTDTPLFSNLDERLSVVNIFVQHDSPCKHECNLNLCYVQCCLRTMKPFDRPFNSTQITNDFPNRTII